MINTIIFDLGGVIVSKECEKLDALVSKALGIKFEDFKQAAAKYKSDLTKGKLTLLDAYSSLVNELNIGNYSARDILQIHMKIMGRIQCELDQNILYLIQRLRGEYRVVCLINTEPEVAVLARKNGLFAYFEKAYISTEMGMKKPDAEIYLVVLKDLHCKPENALFIDDKKENIEGAEKVGIRGIHYKPGMNLQKELARFSIKVK
jgi:FMN phosphatase YigB (HAD superfamily)